MTDSFDRSIAFVLKHEGGYVNHQDDPGGETNFGISKRAYPSLDIKALTREDAAAIYRRDYWEKAGCGALDWPLCLVHFDTAVNMGLARAEEFKSRALNWTDYLFMRIDFYSALVGRSTGKNIFLRGWINRCIDLWKEAKG